MKNSYTFFCHQESAKWFVMWGLPDNHVSMRPSPWDFGVSIGSKNIHPTLKNSDNRAGSTPGSCYMLDFYHHPYPIWLYLLYLCRWSFLHMIYHLDMAFMTATVSSLLTTLVTNDLNTVNRVKSDTDCIYCQLNQFSTCWAFLVHSTRSKFILPNLKSVQFCFPLLWKFLEEAIVDSHSAALRKKLIYAYTTAP